MRMPYSVLSVAVLIACGGHATVQQATPAARAAGTAAPITAIDEEGQPRNPGRMALRVGAARVEMAVTVDRAAIGDEGPRDVAVLLQRGRMAVLADSYGSRPQGLGRRCQAGHEVYVRVVDLRSRRELYGKLVESCGKPIMSGSPAATIRADARSYTLPAWPASLAWRPVVARTSASVTFALVSEPPVTLTLNDDGSFSAKQAAANAGRR